MKVACDMCQHVVEDTLLQILEKGSDILYVCPECYIQDIGGSPEEQP